MILNTMSYSQQLEDNGVCTMGMLGCLVGWVLTFLYEGPVLYAMASAQGVDGIFLNAENLFFLALGLLSGIMIRLPSFTQLRSTIGTAMVACLIISLLVTHLPSKLWYVAFPLLSLAAGLSMTLWAHLLKTSVPKNKRLIAVPVVMLLACVVLTISHILANHISTYAGYAIAELSLMTSLFCLSRLRTPQCKRLLYQLDSPRYILRHFGPLICFILCVTINAGFMFQSVYPLFAKHESLLSFYINIPYMLAIVLLFKFRASNRIQTLYMALALWGMALLMVSHLGMGISSFFLIATGMLFASGMLDFFWWNIFIGSFDAVKNPATPMGIILAANILGALAGGQISNSLAADGISPANMAQLGLMFILLNTVLLSVVRKQILQIMPDAKFLKHKNLPHELDKMMVAREKLSPREMDVFLLLLDGASDKIIANTLHISSNTIKSHNRKIFSKLGMANRIELRKHFCNHTPYKHPQFLPENSH